MTSRQLLLFPVGARCLFSRCRSSTSLSVMGRVHDIIDRFGLLCSVENR